MLISSFGNNKYYVLHTSGSEIVVKPQNYLALNMIRHQRPYRTVTLLDQQI